LILPFKPQTSQSLQLRPVHLYFLYIALVVASIQGFSQQVQRTVLELERGTAISSQAESELHSNSATHSVQEVTIKPELNSNQEIEPVRVDIKLKDQCWLRVVVDGKTEFEGVLPEGTHRTWTANQHLTVRAGNAGGVLVALNKEEAKRLGAPGQVQEITYHAKANF
jgi:cytoskeletal protein RodZ